MNEIKDILVMETLMQNREKQRVYCHMAKEVEKIAIQTDWTDCLAIS